MRIIAFVINSSVRSERLRSDGILDSTVFRVEYSVSGFQMTVEKPKPKQLLRPITTGTNSTMNQSQFLAIIWNSLEAREKSRVHGAIGFGFGFASHWLKKLVRLF